MPIMQSSPGPYTTLDGRRYLYFAGTGYLGLQGHPELIRAAAEATQKYGLGSATSRSGFGQTPPLVELERRAAQWCGQPASFCFASGYDGAALLTDALAGTFDVVLIDELAHYALVEAAERSGRQIVRFRHRDTEHLRELLECNPAAGLRPLVMSDGVFAATGAIAPAAEYRQALAEFNGGTIYLDDAHALGVLGEKGRGTFEYVGLDGSWNATAPGDTTDRVRLYSSATLSKALGAFGGIIAGSQALIAALKDSTRFRGASPPPIPALAAAARALELLATDPAPRARLAENVALLKQSLANLGLPVDDTPVPIVSLVLESGHRMQQVQQALMDEGIAVSYFPTYAGLGPEGGLRIAVFATHTPAMVDQLADALRRNL